MSRSGPWRPTLVIAGVGLLALLGAGALNTALLMTRMDSMVARLLLGGAPPIGGHSRLLGTAALVAVAFLAVLVPLVRAVLGGGAAAPAGIMLGVWGATFLGLAVAGAVRALTLLGSIPAYAFASQIPGIIGGALLSGIWLGLLLGLVALVVRPRTGIAAPPAYGHPPPGYSDPPQPGSPHDRGYTPGH